MSDVRKLAQFRGHRYLNLESYRRDGHAVRTPLWFAEEGGLLYVYTFAAAVKVKRIRRNPRVRVVPSTYGGEPQDEWVEAEATILEGEDGAHGHELLRQKYFLKRVFDFFNRFRGTQHVVIAIRPV